MLYPSIAKPSIRRTKKLLQESVGRSCSDFGDANLMMQFRLCDFHKLANHFRDPIKDF